jgi:hypothetical protein
MLPRGKAVNGIDCAVQHEQCECAIESQRGKQAFVHNSAEGQKSYWGSFHGDVTLDLKLHASIRQKIGAWGRALHQQFRGANNDNGCNGRS